MRILNAFERDSGDRFYIVAQLFGTLLIKIIFGSERCFYLYGCKRALCINDLEFGDIYSVYRKGIESERLLLLCGHYEGVDERVMTLMDEEISIGDYVLTGGELPAMVLVDCLSRFIPGVLGCGDSAEEESFSDGLLEYPQYTRPADFRGMKVPPVLLNGHHAEIAAWRKAQSILKTRAVRPELMEGMGEMKLTKLERRMLTECEIETAGETGDSD